jgi:hypothetical protein
MQSEIAIGSLSACAEAHIHSRGERYIYREIRKSHDEVVIQNNIGKFDWGGSLLRYHWPQKWTPFTLSKSVPLFIIPFRESLCKQDASLQPSHILISIFCKQSMVFPKNPGLILFFSVPSGNK